MVSNLYTRERHEVGKQGFALFSQQASIGASLLLSVLTAALAGYYLGRLVFPHDSGAPLVMSLIFATAMLLIDAFLIILRLSRAAEA